MMLLLFTLCVSAPLIVFAQPRFDPTTSLQEIFVPADAAVGSIIYRLRASDSSFDYPLVFILQQGRSSSTVSVETLNCTRFNSVCQSNVVLRKRLEPDRFYDFIVDVMNQRGDSTSLHCSFRATNATTPIADIFPGAPTLLMVSENSRRNTEIGTILAKGNPAKPKAVLLELWGAPEFGLHQRLVTEKDAEGTILLLSPLDYEKRTVHHLTILANDPWSELDKDTRNIASWPLLVAVLDEQDTPPIFTLAPPTTTLSPSLEPGDLILRVHAEDGDRGKPREVRYGLLTEGNRFSSFFNISDETGELHLVRPLPELLTISHSTQPILITVVAEEVRANPQEFPAQSSTVRLALITPSFRAGIPTFSSNEYNVLLDENSPIGTILDLPQNEIIAQPGNVVTLDLVNNNGTFDIMPSVVEGQSNFQIKVHDPKLLDYELWHSVECLIVAKQIGENNYTAQAKLKALLNDVNDNFPKFIQNQFIGNIQENANIGTTVLRVEAKDIDREPGSKIGYIRLTGAGSQYFALDPETGIITVESSNGLDAETTPVLTFFVEAADEDGKGHTATATVVVNLLDINDESPEFDKNVYEFILNQDRNGFTSKAFIKAFDNDITSPNNEVHYELIDHVDNLTLDENSGELYIQNKWTEDEVKIIRARVWDGGVPRLSTECEIRIYPPEGQSRKMIFIVKGKHPNIDDVLKTLRALTGGRVVINEVKPYTGYIPEATDVSESDSERSVVVTTVSYSKNGVVDVNRVQEILDEREKHRQKTSETKTSGNLLWLLLLLIFLALVIALILIICCICKGCPLYVPPKRRKVASAEVQKFVIKGSGAGRESKSVQVAEWFGRKEAWTPEHVLVDTEVDSIRRHEVERGSERGGAKRTIRRQQQIFREPSRDQLYIRDGNADILRLITRDGEQFQQQQPLQQRPVTLVADPSYFGDNGKDILMRRFINQQQAEAAKSQVILPNAVNRLQTEHELLEASLRQQNALLRQILLEREKDLRLETQSLPAGTQTDQDAGTQTEPQYLRPPIRKVQSDNDASDFSDDELAIVKARARRRNGRKSHIKRQIKTPILEESEIETVEKQHQRQKISKTSATPQIKQTRTSELRQRRASDEMSRTRLSKSGIRKEVLREISASLDRSESENSDEENYNKKKKKKKETNEEEVFSEDSLDDDTSPRSDKTSSSRHRYHSESDLRRSSIQSRSNLNKQTTKSHSQTDLSKISNQSNENKSKKKKTKRTSRYMEWYNKKNPNKTSKESSSKSKNDNKSKHDSKMVEKSSESNENKEDEIIKETTRKISSRLLKDTESSARKKVTSNKPIIGPEHPLLQHSEHRFEAQYLNLGRRPEEDADSGIALTRPAIAQKKSVFTIAYDDMHTSQLRPDSTTPTF